LRVYRQHFPTHRALGDVTALRDDDMSALGPIDLVLGGPPCQNLSSAMGLGRRTGDRRGLAGAQSQLFDHYARVLGASRARHFVMENVASMSRANRDEITRRLREARGGDDVYCTELDSRHVSAQRRRRLYWTSFPVAPLRVDDDTDARTPQLADVLDAPDVAAAPAYAIGESSKVRMGQVVPQWGKTRWQCGRMYADSADPKSHTVTKSWESSTMGCMLVDRRFGDVPLAAYGAEGHGLVRRFTPEETERLQTFPAGWTDALSKTWRYKVMGNAVTCAVAAHVAGCLPL
jgi:DNA (cytosine-5)-methyltransferase 1